MRAWWIPFSLAIALIAGSASGQEIQDEKVDLVGLHKGEWVAVDADRDATVRRRAFALALAAALAGVGCGSEQSKMDRGLVVEDEEAHPTDAADLDETEAERRAQEDREVERKSQEEFNQAQEQTPP
jgi:hypothetical protein